MAPDLIAELDKIGFNWEIRHVVTKKDASAVVKADKLLEASQAIVALLNVAERHVRMVPHAA